MRYVLGVDGGGTKTLAAVADETGRVLGLGRAEGCNFQGIGVVRSGIELKAAIDRALEVSGVSAESIAHAAYGISGADRDKDFDIVHGYVEPANPAPEYLLVNDTTIALRAGTRDGVGVALIAGTGSNTIGYNKQGEQAKVGGMGRFSGDYGSSTDIVEKGIVAAVKAFDGRGPKTVLERMFCEAAGVENILDIMEFFYVDNYRPIDIGSYAPIVFGAANAGDKVAIGILRLTGKQLAKEAIACIRRLFPKDAPCIPVVLGGSIFQKGENPTLIDTLEAELLKKYPQVRIIKLSAEPLLGAILFALDRLHGKTTPRRVSALARRTIRELIRKEAGSGAQQ